MPAHVNVRTKSHTFPQTVKPQNFDFDFTTPESTAWDMVWANHFARNGTTI
jgi:hypothetical protein